MSHEFVVKNGLITPNISVTNGGSVTASNFVGNLTGSAKYLASMVDVTLYGATGDGITDDSTAINNAAIYARNNNLPLYFPAPSSSYLCNSQLDLRGIRKIDMDLGASYGIVSTTSNISAVLIGGTTSSNFAGGEIKLFVTNANQATRWTTSGSAVEINRMYQSSMELYLRGFETNLKIQPTTGQAFTYNSVRINGISRGKYNIALKATGSGYINQNQFYGGVLYLENSSSVSASANVYIRTDNTGQVDDNIFNEVDFASNINSVGDALIFKVEANGATDGTTDIRAVKCRAEVEGGGDIPLINIPTTTNNRQVESYIDLVNYDSSKFYPIIGTPLIKHYVYYTNQSVVTPSYNYNPPKKNAGLELPIYVSGNGTLRAPNRTIYRNSTAAIVEAANVNANLVSAYGNYASTYNDTDFIIGQMYTKPTGSVTYLKLPTGIDMGVVCYDATGSLLSGSSTYYAMGAGLRTQTIGSTSFYQFSGGWLYLHKNVAKFILGFNPWNASTAQYQDIDVEHLSGAPIRLISSDNNVQNQLVSTGIPKAFFGRGTVVGDTGGISYINSLDFSSSLLTLAPSGSFTVSGSFSSLNNGDYIGIQTDTKVLGQNLWHVTTVNGPVVAGLLTMSAALPYSASAANAVRANRWSTYSTVISGSTATIGTGSFDMVIVGETPSTSVTTSRLSIKDSSNDSHIRFSGGGSGNRNVNLYMGTDTRDWQLQALSSSNQYNFQINYNGTNAPTSSILLLKPTGQVSVKTSLGIGTTSPAYPLDVAGNARLKSGSVIYPYTTTADNTIVSGSGKIAHYYPNVFGYNTAAGLSGSVIVHTNLTRSSSEMFRFDVKGYHYQNYQVIDYSIVGYMYASGTANIDNGSGAIINYSIVDRGNDNMPKAIGVDKNGYVAFALGHTGSTYANQTFKFTVDYYSLSADTTNPANWYADLATGSASGTGSYGWSDEHILTPAISQYQSLNSGYGVAIGSGYTNSTASYNPPSNGLIVQGNVGIGTTNPTSKLQIVGNVSASSFTGSLFGTSSWASNVATASSLNVANSYKITNLTASTISASAISASNIYGFVITGDSRYNVLTNPTINIIEDTNVATNNVTLTAAGGTQRNIIGTNTKTTVTAGTIYSGTILGGRSYVVTGSGNITYNGTSYSSGSTFVGIYGVKTFSTTGSATVKNPITYLPDSAYITGTAYVASIVGGYDHLNNQIAGTIGGGGHNELRSGGNHATICGGSYNVQNAGLYSVIVGGTQNEQSQDFGFIGGGWGNTITSNIVPGADYSVILAGGENRIDDNYAALIINGNNNYIINPSSLGPTDCCYNTVLNGLSNNISGSTYSTILNGSGNVMTGRASYNCTIINGTNITFNGTSSYVIASGNGSTITSLSRGIVIGDSNTAGTGSHNSIIGQSNSLIGGIYNFTFGLSNTTTGSTARTWNVGTGNTINGITTDTLLFGTTNYADTTTYSIASGINNALSASTQYGYVFGNANTLKGGATYHLVSGLNNTISSSDYGFIAGNSCSIADTTLGLANYSSVLGYQGTARTWGQHVESNGKLNTTIEAQRSRYLMSRRYTHTSSVALTTDLRVDGSGYYITVPSQSVWAVNAQIVGSDSTGTKYGTWTCDFAVRNNAGSLIVLGSPTASIVYNGHSSTWNVNPAIRSSPLGITFGVTASNGETVNWLASVNTTELSNAW